MEISKLHGILLAGGMSRRFGSPKAFALYKGKYFYQWILEAMNKYVGEVTIVSHESLFSKFSSHGKYHLILDEERYRGFGPLAGIYSAMKHTNAKWYLVMACDTPNMTSDFVRKLLCFNRDDVDIVIPTINGKMQPLAGLYHHRVFPMIEDLLDHGDYSVKSLLKKCKIRFVNETELLLDEKVFWNINNQDEYRKLD